MRIRLGIALGALLLASACGGDDEPPLPSNYDPASTSSHPLLVMNASQFPVLELYVHEAPDFAGSANLLTAELQREVGCPGRNS